MKKILFLLCLPLFVHAQNFDVNTLKKLNRDRNQHLDGTMHFISNSEYVVGIVSPVSVCLAAWGRKDFSLLEKGVNMSLAIVLNSAATYVVKRVVDRPRPGVTYSFLQPLESERHFSFPSGHSSNAFCTATALSLNFKKWYVIVPSYAWATTVAYSRMHLGMHYPSDVFAGALLGAGSAYVTYKANKWLKKKYAGKFWKEE
jgi:membrane-associated phospholipid phosphatase